MKKKIFRNTLLLAGVSLLLAAAVLCLVFYNQFSSVTVNEIRNRAETFIDNSSETAVEALAITKISDMRVTIIKPDGDVIFDNAVQPENLLNHGSRSEVREAFLNGTGQSKRYSETLGKETVYYAVRLTDGYVLRTAKTISSIFGIFTDALPPVIIAVIIMGVICYFTAGKLTRGIVKPLYELDLNREPTAPYEELVPFIQTIAEQRGYISRQILDLRNRADIMNAIMDNINEGIILTDDTGGVISANKSVLRIFEKSEILNEKNTFDFLANTEFAILLNEALAGGHGEMSVERAEKIYRIYFSHVSGGGAIILFLDITEKAKSEKLRREFSANVSHELKTPLTSIYGNAEMLHNGIVKESDKIKFYAEIKNEAGRMITLIEDILMISKLDEGGGRESFENFDLSAVASEAVKALSQKALSNNITVKVSGEKAYINANRSLMYEMFFNLIDNAIKYNKPGGIAQISIRHVNGEYTVSVSDTGIGIPKESQSRVFERFYRVDKSRSKKTGGTGLGLAIVKHIVLVHGGKVELDSRENEGTTITINFFE